MWVQHLGNRQAEATSILQPQAAQLSRLQARTMRPFLCAGYVPPPDGICFQISS